MASKGSIPVKTDSQASDKASAAKKETPGHNKTKCSGLIVFKVRLDAIAMAAIAQYCLKLLHEYGMYGNEPQRIFLFRAMKWNQGFFIW